MVDMVSEAQRTIKEVKEKRAVMEEAICLVVRDGEKKIVNLVAREILNGMNSGISIYKTELKILKGASHEKGMVLKSESDFELHGYETSSPEFDALLASEEGGMARS